MNKRWHITSKDIEENNVAMMRDDGCNVFNWTETKDESGKVTEMQIDYPACFVLTPKK